MLELTKSRRDALASAMMHALKCPAEPKTSSDAIRLGHVRMMQIATGPADHDVANVWNLAVAIDFEKRWITRRTGLKYTTLDVASLTSQLHDAQLAEAAAMLAGIFPRSWGVRIVWSDAPRQYHGSMAPLDLPSILQGWAEI